MKKDKIDKLIEEQKELVSLEILSFKKDVSSLSQEEIKELYSSFDEQFTLIDDLSQPYVIRTVVGKKQEVRSLEPDMVKECDRVEIIESIQDILKSNGLPVYKSEFDEQAIANISEQKKFQLNEAVKHEMLKGLKAMKDGKIALPDSAKDLSDKVVLKKIPKSKANKKAN